MGLTIYGSPRSRTMRVLWMAEELGLDYEHVPYEFDDPVLKTPEFLNQNPAGAIPTIVDGSLTLAESLAINLYLARRYAPETVASMAPLDLADEALAIQWSLWAQGHLEPWVQKDRLLAPLIEAIGDHAAGMIHRSLAVLNDRLGPRNWLLGDRFTVADLNVAGVLSPSRSSALDLTRYHRVKDWLERCYGRPAAVRARQRFNAAG